MWDQIRLFFIVDGVVFVDAIPETSSVGTSPIIPEEVLRSRSVHCGSPRYEV